MKNLDRITFDPAVMGGRPCLRGLRVTVGTVVGLMATGHPRDEILKLYPYLEQDDLDQALAYAAYRGRLQATLRASHGHHGLLRHLGVQ
jgi:uncharacterized protein (DUF433 family)